MNNKYIIGLDLGINNVGWSVLDVEKNVISNKGVLLFNTSDDASTRRGFRSVRRRRKREKNRVNDFYKLLKSIDIENVKTIDEKLLEKRVKSLNSKIEIQELVNIICFHLTHRGYIPFDDEEVNFVDLNGKFPCEYYIDLLKKNGKYRATNEVVKTSEIRKELEKTLSCQSLYYKKIDEIKEEILKIFDRKREFWEGPGDVNSLTPYGRFKSEDDVDTYLNNKKQNSNYEKYLFEDLIGKCNIYLNQRCAPKLNFYAQKFNLINDFINITFNNVDDVIDSKDFQETNNGYKLTDKGLNKIIEYCMKTTKILKINVMLKKLFNVNIDDASGFKIDKNHKIEMSTLNEYRSVHNILEKYNMLDVEWFKDINQYNKIMYYINVSPSKTKLLEMINGDSLIKTKTLEENVIIIQIYTHFKGKSVMGYHSLSEKALIRAINDMLATQMNFQQVKKKFDYEKEYREFYSKNYINDTGEIKLTNKYVDDLIASPQVKKTLRQSIKVINAIIKEQGELPYCIAIESAKELNSKDRKQVIEREQKNNEILKKNAIKIIRNNGYQENDRLIEKVMLYDEINGVCPYCNKQKISLHDVLDNRIEVEHILPISQSFNNSYNNKTIACRNCNDLKKNQTPYQWKKNTDYAEYEERILNNNKLGIEKKQNMLYKDDLNKYNTRFFNRNLRDLSYATKELVNQINMFNDFLTNNSMRRINTLSTPGQITHKIRVDNNLDKDRDDGKFHHAVDASIVAAIANTQLGNIIIESQNNSKFWLSYKENKEKYSNLLLRVNIKDNIDDIKKINNDNIKLSSQVEKDAQSSLANANIVKYIKLENGYNKVDQIDNIYECENKKLDDLFNESNKKHLMIKDNNNSLYKLLKEIYDNYKNEKGNVFKNYCIEKYELDNSKEFNYMIHGIKSSKNIKSPMLKKLRYYSKVTNPFILEDKKSIIGLDSLAQYCTEVYYDIDKNKFKFLPIYSICIDLKNNRINRNNKYYQLLYDDFIGKSNVKFITRLYNGNYVKIVKKNKQMIEGFVQYFDKTNNKIILKNNASFTVNDILFELFDLDVLGNAKKRLTFSVK